MIAWYHYQIKLCGSSGIYCTNTRTIAAFHRQLGYTVPWDLCLGELENIQSNWRRLCMWLRDTVLAWGEGVSVGVCECVRWARDIKVERSRCGWLGFRETASASAVSCMLIHTVCVWYDIHNGTGVSQRVFACLDFSMCMHMCLCVCAFQLKVQ